MTEPDQPDFPIVSGQYRITKEWTISLPLEFKRRFANDSLVFWRPEITVWINVWKNDHSEPASQRFAKMKAARSPRAFNSVDLQSGHLLLHSYRLAEEAEDRRVPALYCLAVGHSGDVQMGLYFNREEDLPVAEALWRSLHEGGAGCEGPMADDEDEPAPSTQDCGNHRKGILSPEAYKGEAVAHAGLLCDTLDFIRQQESPDAGMLRALLEGAVVFPGVKDLDMDCAVIRFTNTPSGNDHFQGYMWEWLEAHTIEERAQRIAQELLELVKEGTIKPH